MKKLGNNQKSMYDFFTTNESSSFVKKDYDLKKYFFLEWNAKRPQDAQALWLNDRPVGLTFIEPLHIPYLKKNVTFYLCGTFPKENSYYILGKEQKYKNIPQLKSHLQKNVRKQDDNLAIPTALHLMKMDMQEFLRRLPIIMIEDVSLHSSFSTIIWFMLAVSHYQKKFTFSKSMYEYLLGIIYVLCTIDKKDIIRLTPEEKEEYDSLIENKDLKVHLNSLVGLKPLELSTLYSMHVRIAYGGMKCDMNMFREYIVKWKNRFEKGKEMNKMLVKPISILVSELELSSWDLSAIDFHCENRILSFLNRRFPDIDEYVLKRIIWVYSSSINKRVEKKQSDYEESNPDYIVWKRIEGELLRTQKYLLESNYHLGGTKDSDDEK